MPAITKIDGSGTAVGEHALPDRLVEYKANIGLLYEVVRSELAARWQGTAKAKRRGEVTGSGEIGSRPLRTG